MIHMTLDTSGLRSRLQAAPHLINAGAATALRNIVKFSGLDKEMDATLKQYVDRPTPFTAMGGKQFYERYPANGTEPLTASFGVKGRQASYLQFIAKGVTRDKKIIERRMPDGKMLLPTKRITLDAHGNVPKDQFLSIVKQAQAKGGQFFYLPQKKGKLFPGIYRKEEKGAAPVPYFFAVNSVDYKRQWDFFGLVEAAIQKRIQPALEDAVAHQLKKAAT